MGWDGERFYVDGFLISLILTLRGLKKWLTFVCLSSLIGFDVS